MKTASLNEIKQELMTLPPKEVLELCLRLIKYKKENKELLTYLLFEAYDVHGYTKTIKKEIDEALAKLPVGNLYLAKKGLRKILNLIAKCSKHSGSKQAEVEMMIHFCIGIDRIGLPMHRSVAITKLFDLQLRKTKLLIEQLHEDLIYDYAKQLENL